MRSGSERMHTWRRTPSTGRNFQTLIIWITVSWKASCNGSISVNKFFFLDFFNFCWVFQKFPFFLSPVYSSEIMWEWMSNCKYLHETEPACNRQKVQVSAVLLQACFSVFMLQPCWVTTGAKLWAGVWASMVWFLVWETHSPLLKNVQTLYGAHLASLGPGALSWEAKWLGVKLTTSTASNT